MKKVTFDEFFKNLLKRKEFFSAFNQVSPNEQEGVRDVAKVMFAHFKILERDLTPEYIDKICQIVEKEGSQGSISVMETAFCNAGNYLPKRYFIPVAA